jgi:glucose/arabinose dehydrogenase
MKPWQWMGALCALGIAAAGRLQPVALAEAFPGLHFESPVFITQDGSGDGRFFVVEQAGRIRAFSRGSSSSSVFLDISGEVRTQNAEEGLLCLAFHPHYAQNHYLYVIYSLAGANPRRTVLARFSALGPSYDRVDPNSEKPIFSVEKPYGNHNGSTLLFGRDGLLYFGLGDGGGGGDPHGNAQNLGSLLGKILRIDVDHPSAAKPYGIPPGNPFASRAGARPEIYAYGMRNPWRMSFDSLTDELWAGDVGQDRWEEIDLIRKGGNYGWNFKEGSHPFKGDPGGQALVEPVLDYGRKDGFCVTGGYVYRGTKLPALKGCYVYGDYGSKRIWSLPVAHPSPENRREIARNDEAISSFGCDEEGEIYVVGYAGTIKVLQ